MTDIQLEEHESKCIRCKLIKWLWWYSGVAKHYNDYRYGDLK